MTFKIEIEALSRLENVAWFEFDKNREKRKIILIRKNRFGIEYVNIYGKRINLSEFGRIPQFKMPNQPELFPATN